MTAVSQYMAVFRKEMLTLARHRFTVLTQFLISPTISVVTAGLLYSGFFRHDRTVSLGEMNASNFKVYLLVGLLVHACSSSGYYGLSSKVIRERAAKTLALLWIAPGWRFTRIAALSGPEAIKCAVLAVLGFGTVMLLGGLSAAALMINIGALFLVFVMGLVMGFARAALVLAHEGFADLLDQAYLVFMFTGCLYVPKSLLPSFLWPICEANPLYHATLMMKGAISGADVVVEAVVTSLCLAAVAAATSLLWRRLRPRVLEETPV